MPHYFVKISGEKRDKIYSVGYMVESIRSSIVFLFFFNFLQIIQLLAYSRSIFLNNPLYFLWFLF